MISREGLRAAKKNEHRRAKPVEAPFATIDGLPVRAHPQVSYDALDVTAKPVAYRHFSIDVDSQVAITVLSLADDADVVNLLSGFDLGPILDDLPAIPTVYSPGTGLVLSAVSALSDE